MSLLYYAEPEYTAKIYENWLINMGVEAVSCWWAKIGLMKYFIEVFASKEHVLYSEESFIKSYINIINLRRL